MSELSEYRYRGARALVLLHERELKEFLVAWKRAKAAGVTMPGTDDPSYASLETLLHHVLYCAGSYMIWMCRVLELPDPEIRPAPEADAIAAEAESYIEHVSQRWRTPLADVPEERFDYPTYASGWGVDYCVDAMLEHAVMHPIRHRFQLEEWIAAAARA